MKKKRRRSQRDAWFLDLHKDITLPASIFDNEKLSIFEAIVYHLKEKRALPYHYIAVLLNRDERNIWTVYHNAARKVRPSGTTKKRGDGSE